MNSIQFTRTNGNVPKSLASEDHISGLIAYVATLPSGFSATDRIKAISTIDKAEEYGITADAASWDIKVLHYQLSEIFRLNAGISLYVGLFAKPATGSAYTFAEVITMQNFAGGKIRQIGIWLGNVELTAAILTSLKGVASTLESRDTPLSLFVAPKVTDVTALPTNLAGQNQYRISVVIGQDGEGTAAELYASADNTGAATVSGLGVILGLQSLAAVHESIGWVEKFPTGISLPAFGDGKLYRSLDTAVIESLDTARYIFFMTYSGLSGSYVNDSHTMDSATSDYANIESVRTMDKAVRNIRTYVIPKLGGSLYIDSATGKLQTYTVKYLKTVANKALEDMEKAGELSGYLVEIDPEQNVSSTSTVEFTIKQVAVGVMRHVSIKIGYAESV